MLTATCYRVAKQFQQAKDYLLKASDCYKENRSLFHAARCYEQVNSILPSLSNLQNR